MTLKRLPYEPIAVTGSSRVKRGMAEMLKGGVIAAPHRLAERGW